ncbi:TetR/AcrR family transcriptional regulator [Novosphingobium sp.]|uniref:TetR/AcrR family transcriptional regulator n=1 Tax=Novosphingobium sp. TaxID=1874826 RepID=UPI0025D26EC8|nr:TetR/AcrR family transcriptional regulator [Novosphingobium sp.]MCC6924840.1 TetR/AcrR family transcriptional regulator [Novosphingobium sp.]
MASSAALLPERRTQAQRREASDARLLAAAAAIIAEEGYPAATLERVGERAGFSRGLASRKYGSKDGLIEAVIWRVSAQVNAEVDQAIAGLSDPLDQVLALFDRFVDLAQHDVSVRAYFVLFSAMIANRLETREVFDQVQEQFGQRIEALVLAGQAAGSITPALPAAHIAFMLGSQLAGISIEIAADSAEEADPSALRHDLVALLRRTLAG